MTDKIITLINAATDGDLDIVKMLIQQGIDKDSTNEPVKQASPTVKQAPLKDPPKNQASDQFRQPLVKRSQIVNTTFKRYIYAAEQLHHLNPKKFKQWIQNNMNATQRHRHNYNLLIRLLPGQRLTKGNFGRRMINKPQHHKTPTSTSNLTELLTAINEAEKDNDSITDTNNNSNNNNSNNSSSSSSSSSSNSSSSSSSSNSSSSSSNNNNHAPLPIFNAIPNNSQEDPQPPLDPTTIKIGSLNALSLHRRGDISSGQDTTAGALEWSHWFDKANIQFAFLQETRVPESDANTTTFGKYEWQFSPAAPCGTTTLTKHGMAFACHTDYRHLVREVVHVNPELQYAIIQTDTHLISIINVYAPQSGLSSLEYKNFINGPLETTRLEIEKQYAQTTLIYVQIMAGDFNARLGRGEEPSEDDDNDFLPNLGTDFGGILGSELPDEESSTNGKSLLPYISLHGYIVANSFQYDDNFTTDQHSNGLWTHYQQHTDGALYTSYIDHILVQEKHRHLISQCGIEPTTHHLRKPEGSDHRLLFITLDFTIQPQRITRKRSQGRRKFDWKAVRTDDTLQSELTTLLQQHVSNHMGALPPDACATTKLNTLCASIRTITEENVPRKSQKFRKLWCHGHEIQLEQLLDMKDEANAAWRSNKANPKLKEDLKQARRNFKNYSRKLRSENAAHFADEIATTFAKRDMKTFYELTRNIYDKKATTAIPMMFQDNNTTEYAANDDENLDLWFNYCSTLFSQGTDEEEVLPKALRRIGHLNDPNNRHQPAATAPTTATQSSTLSTLFHTKSDFT